jgi:hypothetical protein
MRNARLMILSWASPLLFFACAREQAPLNRHSKPEITAEDVSYHVNYLASDSLEGRLAGTAGNEAAARYIAAEFKRFGLQPAGEAGDYFQRFDFIGGVKLGQNNKLVYERISDSLVVGADFMPAGFSDSGNLTAALAFVGYGISTPQQQYDDYAAVDVKDRIVMALRYSPEARNPHSVFNAMEALRYKTLQAREHGAKALLIVTGPQDDPQDALPALRYDRSGGEAGLIVAHITRQVADALLSPAGKTIAALQETINSSRQPMSMLIDRRLSLTVEVIKEKRSAANVAGLLPGQDAALQNEYVAIGAHYDHLGRQSEGAMDAEKENEIRNGADDNASGTAGVLELAQYFSSRDEKLKRSLLFLAFSGEELGLLGSAHYVAKPLRPLQSTAAMINMDMIGRLKDSTLVVEGIGTSPPWGEMIERLNRSHGFTLRLKKDGYGPSDHASFYSKNIPVLFFFTNLHDDYHRVSDDAEKINAAGEATILKMVAEAATEIANAAATPQFTKASPDSQPPARGFRVSVGTIPDYAAEANGMKISGVREGSPAEKAGLQGGDVIVKFGQFDIKNVYDYTYALGSFNPGDEVQIVAMRANKKVIVKAKLEGRR